MSDEKKINQSTIRLIQGDITDIEVEAFVFYARPELKLGSGFGNAIAVRGGPTIQKALDELETPVEIGTAVVTEAGKMKAKYIVHAVGPVWHGGTQGESEQLAGCYDHSLQLALDNGLASIAFPAISTGIFGYPLDAATEVAVATVRDFLDKNSAIERVVFCVFGAEAEDAYRRALGR